MCAWLSAAAPYIQAGATAVSAYQLQQQGEQAEQSALFEAAQMDRNAKSAEAVSQREAIRAKREAAYLASRAEAVAASSGGGGSDPTIVNLIGGIEEEGEYNALTALFNGQQRADAMRTGADVARMEGRSKRKAGNTGAFSTVLSGAAKYGLSRYGGNHVGSD